MSKQNKCACASCPDCNGSGIVEIRTGGYPETDLETCSTCKGCGVEEKCLYCTEKEQDDEY